MSGGRIANFRGARALLAVPHDANRVALAAALARLGLVEADTPPFDIAFYDADEGSGAVGVPENVPSVAVIGSEAPSRLLRVVRHRSAAHLMKPVRATGVFTALVLAANEHAARLRAAAEREALASRLSARRAVVKAVLRLMRERDLDDDAAYAVLRVESMRRRVTVESLSAEIVSAPLLAPLIGAAGANMPDTRRINRR